MTEFNFSISPAPLILDHRPGLFRFLNHIRTFLNAALADLRGKCYGLGLVYRVQYYCSLVSLFPNICKPSIRPVDNRIIKVEMAAIVDQYSAQSAKHLFCES